MRPPRLQRPAGTTRRAMRRLGEPACDLPYANDAPATAETLAEEVPVGFSYNGEPHAVMLATPCDLEDFARGFSVTQGIVGDVAEIEAIEIRPELAGIECAIRIPAARAAALQPDARRLPGVSACGLCGIRTLEDAVQWPARVDARITVEGRALHRAFKGMRALQPMFLATGSTHAAGFANEAGEVLCVREDVGRHNALDKLIGALFAAGLDPHRGFVVVTSRASVEMVQKAARAGVGLLAAVSGPTALAVSLADSAGVTLLGFVRDGRHTVYTHPERVLVDGRAAPQRMQEGRREH